MNNERPGPSGPQEQFIIDVTKAHQSMLTVIGLYSLQRLQYDHEGHIDEHVHALLTDELHKVEQQLSNVVGGPSTEDMPF